MRRRRIRRRKTQKSKQIIIISTMCLFLCLCVGYAAFQTDITITATGNILCGGTNAKDKILADSLDSGIYADSYEDDRYVYRGADVDNYITFNNQTWRIIAIESNETLKIVKNDSIGDMAFDTGGYRSGGYCLQGGASQFGCNAWAATSNMVGDITSFENGSYSGAVEDDSYLNDYLNNTYYYTLSEEARSLIVDYTYNIGGVAYSGAVGSTSYTIEDQLADEKKYQWEGYVALMNMSDYVRSNSSTESYCDRAYGSYVNYSTCIKTTWMSTSWSGNWWTITPDGSNSNYVWFVSSIGDFYGISADSSRGVRPVVHLTSDLKLCGSGTSSDPYTIVA